MLSWVLLAVQNQRLDRSRWMGKSECPNDSPCMSWMIIEMEHIHITAEQEQARNSTFLSLLQLKTNPQKITFSPPPADNTHRYEIWWLGGILSFLLIHHNGDWGTAILHLPHIFYFFNWLFMFYGEKEINQFLKFKSTCYSTQFISKFKQLK